MRVCHFQAFGPGRGERPPADRDLGLWPTFRHTESIKETSEMNSNRLAGHELPNEGRVWNGVTSQLGNGYGAIACTCGVESPYLPNTNARKRWHRDHKAAVRAAQQ